MTFGASAPYKEEMQPAAAALLALGAVVSAGWAGSVPPAAQARYEAASAVAQQQLLEAAQVEVVAYPSGDVRICPTRGIATDSGPAEVPPCTDGLRAVGTDTSVLTSQIPGHPERWGFLHLVGTYGNGTFQVASQGPPETPPNPPSPYEAPIPCRRPHGGWRHVAPTQSQRATVDHYFARAHHHDLVSIAFFHGTVLVVSSTDPARTRAVLGPAWPRQLCVVKARHSRAFVNRVRSKLVHLMQPVSRAARYGWVTGAGGYGVNRRGQLTISLDVLIVTPALRTFLRRQPRGLVVVDSTFRPARA